MSDIKELTRADLLLDEPSQPADMVHINELYRRLVALRLLGFKCRVRYAGIYRLLRTCPIGIRLVEVALQVLEWPNEKEKDRFSPLFQLPQILREILTRCFPDAEQDPRFEGPSWLNNAAIEGVQMPCPPEKPKRRQRGCRQRRRGF